MVTTVKRTFTRIAPHGASSQATSSTDWTYCAFIEQLQRIAEQLSARIQGILVGWRACLHDVSHYLAGVIHGDPYVFLDEFSKARAARFH